ncbi:tRNA pseudouridine(38-40) synthase TruA [Chryseomicrobium sp. FSL W7-1435]|uniref:tRNA pseudouridine(38-40) synthase TruA n=1 Tax=Chryseomicrobium sp. FSL W7-1435 TaxID=2921704 RepID=UPI00315AE87A
MRLRAVISYDGSSFSGYQVQPNGRTVQEEIEKVLMTMHKGVFTRVVASGRTDTGVHATGQVIHFDSDLTISPYGWVRGLNAQLPGDIRFLHIEQAADDFHARFDVKWKTYRYKWTLEDIPMPFERHMVSFIPGRQPDVTRMHQAAQQLLGEHDFRSFSAANTSIQDFVRTIYDIQLEQHGHQLHLVITGNGFLYNMVRIIAGTLWEVGTGKLDPSKMSQIISAKDRGRAGRTAPPQGLYLEKVGYEDL